MKRLPYFFTLSMRAPGMDEIVHAMDVTGDDFAVVETMKGYNGRVITFASIDDAHVWYAGVRHDDSTKYAAWIAEHGEVHPFHTFR